jgi:hypothetical protein
LTLGDLVDTGGEEAITLTESQPASGADIIPELVDYPPSLDTAQVAQVLGIGNVGDVSQRLANGVWPGFKVGRDWRMRRSVVQRIMLGQDPFAPGRAAGSDVAENV